MNLAWVLPFLALGLLGAAHCAGMCGGFAIWVGRGTEAARPSLRAPLFYVAGKAVTYAILGVLVSSLAAQWAGTASSSTPSRPADLSILATLCARLAGIVLILHGMACLVGGRAFRHPWLEKFSGRVASFIRRTLAPLLSSVRALPGYTGALGVGLFTGLIPCGLSWSAILLSASLPPMQAAIGMLAFGAATSPALLGVAFGWNVLSGRHRRFAAIALGPLLLLFGALTILRGGTVFETAAAKVLPDCCADSDPLPPR